MHPVEFIEFQDDLEKAAGAWKDKDIIGFLAMVHKAAETRGSTPLTDEQEDDLLAIHRHYRKQP